MARHIFHEDFQEQYSTPEAIYPRGSIYTTIMELGSKRPSPLWFSGPNSIIVVYMDPLGIASSEAMQNQTV